jgi:ectoine hydroxylase-related dioxygenase (phytanoyl-CoA dioxygenase family)
MQTHLTQEQIQFYRTNGFLVVEGFLTPEELAHWQRVTDEAVTMSLQRDGDFFATLNNQKDPDAFYARVFTQCLKLAEIHPEMRELIYNAQIGKMAATLAGLEGIRVWHDQALYKPPFGNPTGWHLDNPYWSFYSRDTLSLWVALDDATLSNGCMYYIPGSHLQATYENAGIGQNIGDLFRLYPQWREIEPVACPCPAGSAVFHNGLTAHGAGANMTNRPRRAMTCGYMPDGATYNGVNRNILPEEYFQTLKAGDILNDNAINPLIWHKSWEA